MDADARFAALKTGSANASSWYGGGWLGWSLSVVLVLISVGNAVYLASRRRKYQLMLRKVSSFQSLSKEGIADLDRSF